MRWVAFQQSDAPCSLYSFFARDMRYSFVGVHMSKIL